MNGSRSTLMRKGYLLTALFAAVLLAASSGTAWAQGVGFTGSSSRTMTEGASPAMTTAAPIEIELRISGLILEGDDADPDALGVLTIQHNADVAPPGEGDALTGAERRVWIDSDSSALDGSAFGSHGNPAAAPHDSLYGLDGDAAGAGSNVIPYDNNGVVKLVIIDPEGDDDWVDSSFTMTLRASGQGIAANPASVKVRITDINSQPTVSFSKTSVNLTEASRGTTPVAINLGVPTGETDPGGMSQLTNSIQFTTSPVGAAVVAADCTVEVAADAVIAITLQGIETFDNMNAMVDAWQVDGNAGAIDGMDTIAIEACGDMSGYRDEMVTFSFVATSLAGVPAGLGNVAGGPDLVVTVRSEGEAVPTVSFATTSLSIDEGMTNTVAIIADGEFGTEVGTVMVSMSGDAMLSLWQGSSMLEANASGMYEVMLGTATSPSANTILTISADSDRALEDGMTSTATLTIESANGATIGDRDSTTVTVTGSTAVAALPLLGQLLLALFLMAGGARLYRRRNG